jgi:uncharacterized protein YecA (UPF0149 family)
MLVGRLLANGTKEAANSARHDRRHGRFVGQVTKPINLGRNRRCPCGSGKKYKRCHLAIDAAAKIALAKTRAK